MEILKACEGLGVKSLSIGELKVTFHDLTNQAEENNNSTKIVPNYHSDVIGPIAKESQDQEQDSSYQDDFQMAHLMAEDPIQYEEALRKANG